MSIFSRIIKGELPAAIVAENEHCIALLDINPLAKGHTLVVPRKEVDYIFDLDDTLYQELFRFAKEVALGLGQAFPCKRVGMAVVGLEVPHAHIHLVPLQTEADISFTQPRMKTNQMELAEMARRAKDAIAASKARTGE